MQRGFDAATDPIIAIGKNAIATLMIPFGNEITQQTQKLGGERQSGRQAVMKGFPAH
jgi:hypothetical protein